jgi:hypothetical protein
MEAAAKRWKGFDEETFHLLLPVHDDMDAYASIVRDRRIQLSQLFERDRANVSKG